MKNSKELELLGEQLSKEYVEDGVDLTSNLKKQASKAELNQQQIRRVAESANVNTYLKLAHLAKDGYVEFKLADAKIVTDELSESYDKAASTIDTKESPWKDLGSPNLHKAEELFGLEKVASDNSVINYHKVANDLAEIKLLETNVDFDYYNLINKYSKVEHQVKQASINNEIADIKEIIKVAAPDNHEILINDLSNNLKEGMPTQDFTKEAECDETEVNKKSELYKAAEEYEEVANTLHDDVVDILNKKLEFGSSVKDTEYKYYIKEAMGKEAKIEFLKNLAKLNPFKNKKRVAATTALLALPLGVSLGKKEEKYKQQQRILMGQRNG